MNLKQKKIDNSWSINKNIWNFQNLFKQYAEKIVSIFQDSEDLI